MTFLGPLAAVTLTHVLEKAGVIVDALLVAAVLSLPAQRLGARARSLAMAAALLLTPVLLAAALWNSGKVATLHHHPLEGVAAVVGAVLIVAALAHLFHKRPMLFPLLAIAALPFRIPLGKISNGLLIPLYVVMAAALVDHMVRTWRQGAEEPGEDGRESGRPQLLEYTLSAYVLLYAIQATYTTDFTKALEQVGFFYVPFALLFSLLRTVRWDRELVRRCLWVIASLAVLFVLVGFGEFLRHHLLLNPTLDSDAYFVRINSLFYDPNIFGRFLALTMIVLAAAMLFDSRRRHVLAAAGALAVMWVGLLLSGSQSSIAALLVGLAVVGAGYWGGRVAAGVAVLAAAVVLVVALLGGASLHVDLSNSSSANAETSGRYSLVTEGVDRFADRPLYGYGSGSFAREYCLHAPCGPTTTRDSHTTPVTVAAEQGVIGLAVYLALLAACLGRLFGGALLGGVERPGGLARLAVAAAFAGLVVHTLLYADFLEDPISWVLLAVGTALAWAAAERGGATSAT